MTRGSERESAMWFNAPCQPDPFVKDWMTVVPLHQRYDRIGELAVYLMNSHPSTVKRTLEAFLHALVP